MAILKDLIVHGSSRFLNKIYASEIQTPLIDADAGVFKKLKADDATVVGLLDVKGQMHTNNWSNSNIATIDGSFYITPTIGSASGTVAITASTLTFSGTNYAISSLYLGDGSSITWPQYSKVLVTGQILSNGEWIPLGTLLGQLSSTATAASISINNIKDNKNQTSNVLATLVNEGTTSSSYRNLKVSLYQRASSSTAFYPLGIYMTATGTNGRTFLDIYGGIEALSNSNNYGGLAEPNVRIGNLQGLPNVGGQTPSGWGIYTDNGYFKGIIAADRGYIGTGSKYWVIANEEDLSNSENSRSYIYNGTNSITSTTTGVYLGTDGIRNYKDSTHYVTIKDGVISALGADLSGKIVATSGTIGGWNIGTDTNKSLYHGNQTPGATTTNLVLSPTSATNSNAIGGSATGLNWFLSAGKVFGVTTAGALYATSGKIGGWNIDSNSFATGSWGTNNSAMLCIGTSGSKSIGGSDSINNWVFTAGANFGVTKSGALYANSANISGKVVATSGSIGGIEIENGVLKVSSINIGNLGGASNYAKKTDVTQAIDNIEADIEDAKKVATNYLSMDSTGIMVADMNDGEQTPSEATGRNVFIDNDSVDIRNGTSTLASFTGDNTKFYDPIYNKELATFGASGATIGVEGEQRFVIEKDSVRAINSSGGTLFSIVSTDKTFITEAEASPSGECSDYLIGDVTRTLDAGDSTTDNSFYIDRIYIIVSLTNSSKVLTNVKINSIAATADRIKYNTNTEFGFAYSSSHSIDVPFSPAFSCNYGTSKSSNYVMTATFVNDYGDSYNLTFSFKITYNGARKLTFSQPTKECIRTSGNNETIAKFDALNPNKYVFSQVISSTANTRAPAMTFGTRTGEDGMLSSAFGQGLYAEKDGEFVIGRYNNQELQTDSKYSFIIGNGEDNEHRSNALTIDWSGNICLGIDVVSSEADAELLIAIQNAGWESSVIE